MPKKVVVAMSGGVDSSVAAALLQQQGYEVIGMMMRLWSEPGRSAQNRCCTPESMAIARKVAGQLDIPFYAVNAQESFRNTVVEYFLDGYKSGVTPNPCLACNRHIRWEFLLDRALAMGADFMATGHYARVDHADGDYVKLYEAIDKNKDQSYVLSVLKQRQLKHALFPLGVYTKPEVRDIASELDLPAAESKESQDLCFLGGEDYRDFLDRHVPELSIPGPITNTEGEALGQHDGLVNYTIGQRKGLGLSSHVPLYVLGKKQKTNTLIVGNRDQLGDSDFTTKQMNWISGETPNEDFQAQVKIRYKASKASAHIQPQKDGSARILFDEPQRGLTPGQAAVIYSDEEVMGSGLISQVTQSISTESLSIEPALA
jgi:tRNA-specific 2-thiouridylase